jgi:hypothetical protein
MNLPRELNAQRITSVLLAGLIAGIVTLISSVSFAALIFNGVLAPYVSSGITILIATAVVAGSLFSLLSSCRPVVAMPDDDTANNRALAACAIPRFESREKAISSIIWACCTAIFLGTSP